MIETFFLLTWSCFFGLVAGWVWLKLNNQSKVYFLLAVNLVFLAGVFWLFPQVHIFYQRFF